MTKKQTQWKLDVCPNCYSQYFVWSDDVDNKYIVCSNCKKESPEPKTIIVVEE